uniref:MgtC/SapB family protein n=1 Tax=Rhodovarius lipocyclicus TaxID=268410 RepID=UPI0013567754
MQFIQTFDLLQFLDSVVSLTAAFVFGALIGAERQYRQRTAGLRTTVLVAVGAAAFVDLAQRIAGTAEAVRVISYVVSGIGFLGAGVIMKDGTNVRGLNTAATLWCAAAVGACTGTDMLAEGALLTFFILFGNTALRHLVNMINRIPISERDGEATYEVSVISTLDAMPQARDLLVEKLEAANYGISDVKVIERGETKAEIKATLVHIALDPAGLEAVLVEVAKAPGVLHTTWDNSRTT